MSERKMNEWTIVLASLATVLAIIALAMSAGRAGAQGDPTPTAQPTATPTATLTEDELITCWWEGDTYICMSAPVEVTATPSLTPIAPQFPANYLPVAFGERFVNIQPRATAEVSGDVR